MAAFIFKDARYEYHVVKVGDEFGIRQTLYPNRGPDSWGPPPPVSVGAGATRTRTEQKSYMYLVQYTTGHGEAFWHNSISRGNQYTPLLWQNKEDLYAYIKAQYPVMVEKIDDPESQTS